MTEPDKSSTGARPTQGTAYRTSHRTAPGGTSRTEAHRPDVGSLLSLPQAAARLQVKEGFIRRLVFERRIPYYKVGRYLRFDPGELDAFVFASRVDAWQPGQWL
jgi:excisionase family DNA binding protein